MTIVISVSFACTDLSSMSGRSMEKNDTSGKNDEEIMTQESQLLQEVQTPTPSSDYSSPSSSTVALGTELLKVSLSGSSINSQLEALSNTNLLTVRIKSADNENSKDEIREVIEKLEAVFHQHKGTLVSAAHIELYEYLPDDERLGILEKNKDVFTFESGSTEFAGFSSGEKKGSDWKYDKVLQVQFKRLNTLKAVCAIAQGILKDKKHVLDEWSISINDHALAQPGNLYIKGVPKNMLMDQIVPVFSKFGPVSSLKIICDHITGESLGYGFISYVLGSQASKCINELNGKKLGSSTLFINYHIERKERERIYRDNMKENSDDEKFKGIFVGNLPLLNSNDETLTPEDVIKLFREGLASSFTDLVIESAYFPRKHRKDGSQSHSEIDTEEEYEGVKGDNVIKENCVGSQSENPLKNYGFIKFANHSQALKAIELFNDFEWLGSKLVVNKAVQNKSQLSHHKKPLIPTNFSPRYDNQYYASPSLYGFYGGAGNMFFPYMSPRGSLSTSSSIETDLSEGEPVHPLNRPVSAGPYFRSYRNFDPVPKTQQGSHLGPYDPPAPNTPMFPMNAYGLLPQGSPFALPLPTRDQQESNLYVKHIPLSWRDEDLYEFYQTFGEIISAKIITVGGGRNKDLEIENSSIPGSANSDSKDLGTSRGYGFVCFKNPLDASRAILATDDFPISDTHTLHVSFAQKRAKFNQSGADGESNFQRAGRDNHSSLKSASRRASSGDQSRGHLNIKFLNAMRQQRASTGGNIPNNFIPGAAWPGVPIIPPSVPPTLAPVPFVPSNANPSMMMMGSYMIRQPRLINEDDSHDEASN